MKIYLVGGAVRDQLLDLPVTEQDWVVVGSTREEMLELGYRQVGRDFPVYLHPDTAEEYALARTERKTASGHVGFETNSEPSVTLEQDLSRRDLTINAIARDSDGQLIDPYGGQADLAARRLRHVSPAFVEDPLRVLRVARFAARFATLGFNVAPETLELMREIVDSGELETLASERIWGELERAFGYDSPQQFLQLLADCGALARLMPELEPRDEALKRLTSATACSDIAEIRFAALFVDMAAEAAQQLCERLNAPRRFRELALLCSRHSDSIRRAADLQAAQLLRLLMQADALRRPERFEQLLQTCSAVDPATEQQVALMRRALEACQQISSRQWANSDLSGQEIGERIRLEREQRLAELLD
ncbi:MAG: hypothetical protein ABJ308_16100 [Halieaceae bacterium]